MIHKRIIIALSILCHVTTLVHAQEVEEPDSVAESTQSSVIENAISLPEQMTPSPKATMIGRFGQYPPNLYTGMVDITIPIFMIQEKNVSVPIEFKYHASGLKYDDLPMELGYGWTLMAGGAVTYCRRGTGVHPPTGTLKDPYIKLVSNIERFVTNPNGYITGYEDQESLDQVINGQRGPYESSGDYRDSEYDVYNFTLPNYFAQYYRLEGSASEFTVPQSTWIFGGGSYPTARDGYGNDYKFEVSDCDMSGKTFTNYLTKIHCAESNSDITFTYQNVGVGESNDNVRTIIEDYVKIQRQHYAGGVISLPYFPYTAVSHTVNKEYRCPLLKEISYRGGKVKFTYSTNKTHSLKQIDVYGAANNLIRTVKLEKTTDERYLNAVCFYDATGTKIYSYQFEYYGTKPESLKGVDYWGYYNSSSKPDIYVPNFTIPVDNGTRDLSQTDRSPNLQQTMSGILKKMVFPTKGYSYYDYELNRASGQSYGGLRIKQISNYDENGSLLETHRYKYGDQENGDGRLVREINSNDYLVPSRAVILHYEGHSLLFSDVETHTYLSFPICDYFTQGSPVVYPTVTEYIGKEGESKGKIRYYYTDYANQYNSVTMRGFSTEHPLYSNEWKSGKLLYKVVYDSNNNVVYSLNNTYKEINKENYLNLSVSEYFAQNSHNPDDLAHPAYADLFQGSLYDYYNYYISSGDYVVSKAVEYADGITKTTLYDDFNALGQAQTITVKGSDGNDYITKLKYPYDLDREGGNPFYTQMYYKNVVLPLVDQRDYQGSLLLSRQVNEFTDNYYEPKYLKQQNGSSLDTRLVYTYDSKGNVRSVVKDGLESVFYVWGCNGTLPVAEVKGPSALSVASILTTSILDGLLTSPTPTAAQMTAVEGLRSNATLSNCLITTMYYNTKNQLIKAIGPNGQITTYDYDSFGRLADEKNHHGHIVEAYDYDYKQ